MNPTPPGGNYPGNYPPSYTGNQQAAQAPYPQQAPRPYGQPMQPQYQYPQMKPFSTKAIVSMVMGGISVMMWPLGPITGLIGAILGFMGMKECKEPGATHRGHGLALGGLITSGLMFLGSLGIYAIVVFAFVMAAEESGKWETQIQQSQSDRDLTLIAQRLNLYAIENKRSLAPGGPVVNDGWAVSFDENTPKVQGRLQLKDLVREVELERLMSEYTLEVTSNSQATVRNSSTGATLVVTDAAANQWRIDKGSNP